MKYLEWNKEKNKKLKRERNISFETIIKILRKRWMEINKGF
jgi:uncharacterized DUF497 family protein